MRALAPALLAALSLLASACTPGSEYTQTDAEKALAEYYGACLALSEVIRTYPWMAPRITRESDEALNMRANIESGLDSLDGRADFSVYELLINEDERGMPCSRDIYYEEGR